MCYKSQYKLNVKITPIPLWGLLCTVAFQPLAMASAEKRNTLRPSTRVQDHRLPLNPPCARLEKHSPSIEPQIGTSTHLANRKSTMLHRESIRNSYRNYYAIFPKLRCPPIPCKTD